MTTARLYLPANWLDEVTPKYQADPAAFAWRRKDGSWHLIPSVDEIYEPEEYDHYSTPITAGDTIDFVTIEQHGEAVLTVRDDGTFATSSPIPADANRVWIYHDPETGCRDLEELVRESEMAPGSCPVAWCVTGKARLKFAFTAATPHFVPLEEPTP